MESCCRISVTYDSNAVVAYSDRTILKEYSKNGQLLTELVIHITDGVGDFRHASKLHSGLFLRSYLILPNPQNPCLVDGNGDVLKSVSKIEGPGNVLDVPCFLLFM